MSERVKELIGCGEASPASLRSLTGIASLHPSYTSILNNFSALSVSRSNPLMNSRRQRAAARARNKNPMGLCANVLTVFRHDLAA